MQFHGDGLSSHYHRFHFVRSIALGHRGIDGTGGGASPRPVGLGASLCKEMGMIPDPEEMIPAPHAPTGLACLTRSPRSEAEREVLPARRGCSRLLCSSLSPPMAGNEKKIFRPSHDMTEKTQEHHCHMFSYTRYAFIFSFALCYQTLT